MTLRTNTILAQKASNPLTTNSSLKRKSLHDPESEGRVKTNKIFKDASEFFDHVSSAETEPAEDVFVEKEVIKSKTKLVIKQEVEDAAIKTEVSETDLEAECIIDNLLIDNLLVSDDDDDDQNDLYATFLSGLLQNKTKKSIDSVQSLIYDSLRKKNKEIETLKAANSSLKDDFSSKIQVKKEILDDNMQKSKSEYDQKIRNIDEEQEYLIEEIKIKDDEIKMKDQEFKKKNMVLKDLTVKLERSEKLISELQKTLIDKEKVLVRSEEKNGRLEGRISMLSKKRPQKSETENRLLQAEEELEKMRDGKVKLENLIVEKDDDVARLEEQKYFLENNLLQRQLEVKKKDEQKMYLEKDMNEQKGHYEKELRVMHEEIKNIKFENVSSQKELKESDKQMKTKAFKIKDLEATISKRDSLLKEEKMSKEKQALKIRQLEEAAKVTEEYKLDLENKIHETEGNIGDLNNTIQKLQEENNTIIIEDLKVIGKGREEIAVFKNKIYELEAEVGALVGEKDLLKNNLAGKEQEQISLQIIASEKDEVIFEKNKNIEKFKKKNEKLKTKIIEIAELKDGLDNRITITEMKYFNLEKDLSLKQTEIKNLNDTHLGELQKLELEKKNLVEESEKEKAAMDEKLKKTKTFLLEQINLIKKKSGDKINLSTDTIVI